MPKLAQASLCLALVAVPCAEPAAARQAACSKTTTVHAAAQVIGARQSLLALPLDDGWQTDVSRDARHAIAAMKARLGDFVTAYLRCAPAAPDPEALERELSTLAHGKDALPKAANGYGAVLEFGVKRPADEPRLLTVTASFSIVCGSDAMLFVFAHDNGAWHEVLRWQSKPYRTVAGAFWSFGYAISPRDARGRWFVVTKSVRPWCSSTWSSIAYSVLRPVANRREPRDLRTASEWMWWGGEDFGTLTAGPAELDVRFHGTSIDDGVHNRLWIRHFRVVGNTLRRVQPVADSPRDFVDEWIVSSWQEASAWSLASRAGQLRRIHRRLHRLSYFNYASVRRCLDRPDHHQIELVHEDDPPYYVHVLGRTAYELSGIATKPDPACDGKNLMEAPDQR
jgi:hypothetical protein